MDTFDVQFGELIDIYGRAAKSKEITYVPARVQLSGTMLSSEMYFDEHSKMPRGCVPAHADAAFVRARIPRVFGYTPTYNEEQEKSLLSDGFVALLPDGKTTIPFECYDYYGRSSLTFSEDGPTAAVKTQIADGFWELIASEPNELDDFEQSVFHSGACVWMHFGCKDGQVYCDESEER
jgi:hypothetical protein